MTGPHAGSPRSRLAAWLRLPGRRAQDPGGRWADETLRPLRRRTADCDVAPALMARILAERDAIRPATTSPRAAGIAWVSSLGLGVASFAFLVATLLVLVIGRDQGVREIVALAASTWQVMIIVGRLMIGTGARLLAAALPILRATCALLEITTPITRAAATLAAGGGLLSILFSGYVFANARKTAPRLGA